MKIRKIIGWILFIVGLVIILWALYSSYRIFTAKVEAPEIFEIKEKELTQEEKTELSPESSPEELQEAMKKIIEEQMKDMIPPGFLNLISWSIFAGILILGGSRISGLGIRLIIK